ncbi:hypothetical protein ACFFQF_32405 [Haladaptatus pallidirubidus]|uniref:hypothetical protein n=1 Tax=Haladaptatus pallidirubidus TaxID=1008152 RepID=UPI0035E85C07
MSNHDTDREQMHNQDRHAPNPDERGKGLSALIALLGLWLILQAFLFELAATQVWNDVLVGAFQPPSACTTIPVSQISS